MKVVVIIFVALFSMFLQVKTQNNNSSKMKLNKLTDEEKSVLLFKATERPFTGEFLKNKVKGIYLCKQCDSPLYRSDDKFESNCGWPSFDAEIKGAITRIPDADGYRTEIVCAHCGGHLGHVFIGEMFTDKNTRHCVNSISLKFTPIDSLNIQKAYFASGCFWGTEYHFLRAKGVVRCAVGYMGGHTLTPTYKEVCTGETGHVETVEVEYADIFTSYDELVKLFFETHDFTQLGGQGPDIGDQYRSVIFFTNQKQKEVAIKNIEILKEKGYKVVTELIKAPSFWIAEDYHQEYYDKKNASPYCHIYHKIF